MVVCAYDLPETGSSDGAASAADRSQVFIWILSFSCSKGLGCILALLLKQLQGAEVSPTHGALHYLLPVCQPLVVGPHLHAGDVDAVTTAEPVRERGAGNVSGKSSNGCIRRSEYHILYYIRHSEL